RPGARLDLGAIAKGYALDRLAGQLRAAHAAADGSGPVALLNFGQSSYWALGTPPDAEVWTLLLRHPARETPAGTIGLRNQALSISAALGDSSVIEGRRYGHVIDPRTGEPLHRAAQVAALAPDATQAEAISTAVLVLGADEGLAWVESLPGCEALWIDAGSERATAGWSAAARYQPMPGASDPVDP
ncbi:MAG: FAD:protein FMN transferase, partial [Gammaproteobacteria bacterium]|nr:FAD:protein FMN transferase [Gammaproteobacteria bacterium]